MDAEELDELKPPRPRLIIPLASGDAAAIKKLSNDDAEENLGMKVQPDGCNISHLSILKDKIETWTLKVDGSQLPARAMWQSYTQQLQLDLPSIADWAYASIFAVAVRFQK